MRFEDTDELYTPSDALQVENLHPEKQDAVQSLLRFLRGIHETTNKWEDDKNYDQATGGAAP